MLIVDVKEISLLHCEAVTLFFPCLADNVPSSSPAAVPLKEDNCWSPSMNVTTL